MAEDQNPTSGAEETTEATEQTTTGGSQDTVENPEGGDNTQQPQVSDDEPAIPVRKSAKDYINERRSNRLGKVEKTPATAPATDDNDDDEEELTPTGRKAIDEAVDEKVSPLIKAQREQADEIELRDVLTTHPEFKPYEKLIRKNMAVHTTLPILQLAYAVAGDRLLQLGGKKKAEADQEAKTQNLGASTQKQEPAKDPDYSKMSREDFNKVRNRALGRDM